MLSKITGGTGTGAGTGISGSTGISTTTTHNLETTPTVPTVSPNTLKSFTNITLSPPKQSPPHTGRESREIENSLHIDTGEFYKHSGAMFFALHLLLEDLKLNTLYMGVGGELRGMLWEVGMCLGEGYAGYVHYYVREQPELILGGKREKYIRWAGGNGDMGNMNPLNPLNPLNKPGTYKPTADPEHPLPDLFLWMRQVIQGNMVTAPYPVLMSETLKVCKIYSAISGQPIHLMPLKLLYLHYVKGGSQAATNIPPRTLNIPQVLPSPQRITHPIFSLHPAEETISEYIEFNNQTASQRAHQQQPIISQVLLTLLQEQISYSQIQFFPFAISIPLYEILHHLRENPQLLRNLGDWPDSAFKLIGREDICLNMASRGMGVNDMIPGGFGESRFYDTTLKGLDETISFGGMNIKSPCRGGGKLTGNGDKQDKHGKGVFQHLDIFEFLGKKHDLAKGNAPNTWGMGESVGNAYSIGEERFNMDDRYKEVRFLLDSGRDVKLKEMRGEEGDAGGDQQELYRGVLYKMCTRHLGKGVGRGAVGYATISTLPTHTLPIPQIVYILYILYIRV